MQQFLYQPIITHRVIGNWFYVMTFALLVLSFYLLKRRKIVKFGLIIYGTGSFLNFLWELNMALSGTRAYQSGFPFLPEMIYHSVTETGPIIIIFIILLEKFKILDLKKYAD